MKRGIMFLTGMICVMSIGIMGYGMESGMESTVQTEEIQTEEIQSEEMQTQDSLQEETSENETEEAACVVVIDAGHQEKMDKTKEPIGPGAKTMKMKVTAGTQGCATKIPEYVLTLELALKLQEVLEERGYEVVMVRTTHDVNISNSRRAEIANEAGADAFIRIHANSYTDSSVRGLLTICQTKKNPYNAELYEKSRLLSDCVLSEMKTETESKGKVWETDTMSGINWCKTPVTIVEVGYMSNPTEDRLLATEEYRMKLVEGMADGIDRYFESLSAE